MYYILAIYIQWGKNHSNYGYEKLSIPSKCFFKRKKGKKNESEIPNLK